MCIYFNTYILIHIYFDVALTQMDVNFNGKLQRNFPLRMSFLEPCFRPLVTGNHFSFGTFSNKTLPKMSQPLYPTLLKTPYLKRGLALWSATHNNWQWVCTERQHIEWGPPGCKMGHLRLFSTPIPLLLDGRQTHSSLSPANLLSSSIKCRWWPLPAWVFVGINWDNEGNFACRCSCTWDFLQYRISTDFWREVLQPCRDTWKDGAS